MTPDIVQCSNCGWVHFAVTRDYAEKQVAEFNVFFEQATEETKQSYGGHKATIEQYERCFSCGKSYTQMTPNVTKKLNGQTIQPILYKP